MVHGTVVLLKSLLFYYENKPAAKIFEFSRLEDLKKYKVGGVNGYFYEEMFRNAGLGIDYVNKEISGLEKLKLGRIDLMPVNELVGWHLIQKHFPNETDNFKVLGKPLDVSQLHLIVSKTYPRSEVLLGQFNAALKSCIQKGLIPVLECR